MTIYHTIYKIIKNNNLKTIVINPITQHTTKYLPIPKLNLYKFKIHKYKKPLHSFLFILYPQIHQNFS